MASMVLEDEAVEVPSVGGRKPRELSRQVMAQILGPRAEELFGLLRDEIVRAGFQKMLNAGVVLTGGGSLLPGTVEIAEQVFDLPVRTGMPRDVGGLGEVIAPPVTTGIGLALWAGKHRQDTRRRNESAGAGMFGRVGGRMRTWWTEMFH
jgi:cell division protein FtsA